MRFEVFSCSIFVVDREILAQSRLKNFLAKKEKGMLATTAAEAKFARALQPVSRFLFFWFLIDYLSVVFFSLTQIELRPLSNDGFVHFGDTAMIFNQKASRNDIF